MNKTVKVAKSAGFCFGVDRAVKLAYETVNQKGRVFTLGPIIHNPDVVKDLDAKGVKVIDDLSCVTSDDTVIIRSHGVGKSVYDELEAIGSSVIDATCPFVSKIHQIVKERSAAGDIVIIAGDKSHPEVQGICGHCQGEYHVVSNSEEFVELMRKNYENCKKGLAKGRVVL